MNDMIEDKLTIIRTNRKTLALVVTHEGKVLARAPLSMPTDKIIEFVQSKSEWIDKKQAQFAQSRQNESCVERLTMEEIRKLGEQAYDVIFDRVFFYAAKMNVHFASITIRNQKTRWGSCSAKGNLNFNCLLMLTPPEVIDSVVVHELCHLKEMNYSAKFYEEVLRVFPDYYKWNACLKENGPALMRRMTG